jgi:hypothetical protein
MHLKRELEGGKNWVGEGLHQVFQLPSASQLLAMETKTQKNVRTRDKGRERERKRVKILGDKQN